MVDISERRETAVATGPAWQVRETARQKLLEGIKQKIIRREDDFAEHNLFNLYWTLSYLFYSQIQFSHGGIGYVDLSKSGWANERLTFQLFSEVLKEVKEFQRSEEEGRALLGELLEWAANEIARPHYSALGTQEVDEPKIIYGVEDRNEEIPFE